MVKRVYGEADGFKVEFTWTGDAWQAEVPAAEDGSYVVGLYAEDEAGNVAYMATVLFIVAPGKLEIKVDSVDYALRLFDTFGTKIHWREYANEG